VSAAHSATSIKPGCPVLETRGASMECSSSARSPRILVPSHPEFSDLNIAALVIMVSYRCQDESRLIRCCDNQDPDLMASHEDILARHSLAIKCTIYPGRRHSAFMLHDEYCNSNPMALKGWSFLFISMEDPRVNSSSLTLPSHNSPILQF
jgi:hypothetical protein